MKKQNQPNQEQEVIIKVEHLTKDYGRGRGIFDISFEIKKGTTFGYCGTNGSGKTTTLRHIMGFLKPDSGKVTVKGLDAWKDAQEIKKYIGYLPGEIAFPQVENGTEFLKLQAEMIGLEDMSKAERIINTMQLDPTANLKRMSKGMKQKTAIVASMMGSPEILVLDEPSTGLDPLMRDAFVNLIKEEKARGTTIIMSNHMFDELDETCDYVGFIKDGRLVDIVDMKEIHERPFKEYKVGFFTTEEYEKADRKPFKIIKEVPNRDYFIVRVDIKKTNEFISILQNYNIKFVTEVRYTLENYFMNEVIGGK